MFEDEEPALPCGLGDPPFDDGPEIPVFVDPLPPPVDFWG
jgi:hypothetical protein